MIPLDRNESYWLLDDALLAACKDYDVRVLSTYPQYEELKQKVAAYAGVSTDSVALTPGSDAAIQELARLYVGDGRTALLPVPTFYGYESVLARVRASVIPAYYFEKDGAFHFPVEEVCALMQSEKPAAVFLCNPNNPLGCPIPDDELQQVMDAASASDTLLVVDEAYYEYSGRTVVSELDSHPNLIILRTFSKGFGIPGARVGYAIAAPEIIKKIEALLLPWPIAHTSLFAASTLLDRAGAVAARRQRTVEARETFHAELSQRTRGILYPSETNFLLMRIESSQEIARKLKEQGIAVATGEWMSGFLEAKQLLESTLRIATPSPEDRRRVIDSIAYL